MPSGLGRHERLLLLVLAGIALNLLLIVNPGFFSHDEVHNLRVAHSEFTNWIDAAFGRHLFFRPPGDLWQFTLLRIFEQTPQAIHFYSVCMTIGGGLALWKLLVALGAGEATGQVAYLLFVVSPLTAFGGWIGVLYDQTYVLLLLLLLLAMVRGWPRGALARAAFTAGVVLLAILFKETALIAPAAIAILWWWERGRRSRLIEVVAATAAAGVLIGLRIPELAAAHREQGAGYHLEFLNMFKNTPAYLVFPFNPMTREVITVFLEGGPVAWLAAAVGHLALIAILARARWQLALLYLVVYFLPLGPILFLSKIETQLLYGSAVALSAALAWIIVEQRGWARAVGLTLAALSVVHGLRIQQHIFHSGRVHHNLMVTFDVFLRREAARHPGAVREILIEPDVGAPDFVASRMVFDLYEFNGADLSGVRVLPPGTHGPDDALRLRMTAEGELIPR